MPFVSLDIVQINLAISLDSNEHIDDQLLSHSKVSRSHPEMEDLGRSALCDAKCPEGDLDDETMVPFQLRLPVDEMSVHSAYDLTESPDSDARASSEEVRRAFQPHYAKHQLLPQNSTPHHLHLLFDYLPLTIDVPMPPSDYDSHDDEAPGPFSRLTRPVGPIPSLSLSFSFSLFLSPSPSVSLSPSLFLSPSPSPALSLSLLLFLSLSFSFSVSLSLSPSLSFSPSLCLCLCLVHSPCLVHAVVPRLGVARDLGRVLGQPLGLVLPQIPAHWVQVPFPHATMDDVSELAEVVGDEPHVEMKGMQDDAPITK
jgi:hypothetical protein